MNDDAKTHERERIARIVQALLAKANDAGATEDEALSAARKAQELLEKHQLTMSDAELMSEGFSEEILQGNNQLKRQLIRFIAASVSKWAGTTSIIIKNGNINKIKLFGLKSDVALASWLTMSLADFVMKGAKEHSSNIRRQRTYAYAAYNKIADRLNTMHEANTAPTDGRSLVVVKGALAKEEAILRFNPGKSAHRRISIVGSQSDFDAGMARGAAAQFNRPVGKDEALALPKS